MTDSIWREDEDANAGSPQILQPSGAASWADAETAEEQSPGRSAALWRQDEGAAWVQLPQEPSVEEPLEPEIERSEDTKRKRIKHRRSQRSPAVGYAVGIAILFSVLLIADGIYAGVTLADTLPRTAAGLEEVQAALTAGRPEIARRAALATRERAAGAVNAARHPGAIVAGFIPIIGADVRALAALSFAAESTASAAVAGADAAEQIGLDGEVTGALYENGRVNLEIIPAVRPLIGDVVADLLDASDALDGLRAPRVPTIANALRTARDRVERAFETARRAGVLMSALPDLLGEDETREYLLAFQATGEARATGGVAGLYGILTARDGKLRLREIAPYGDLFEARRRPVAIDDWFQSSYASQAATTQWPQANVSPNFPVVAEVMMEMYRTASGDSVDGVVAMDPVALEDLLVATGPVRAAGQDITAATVKELLLHDSYLRFPQADAQNAFLAEVVRSFWADVRRGSLDLAAMAGALQEAGNAQHVKFYSREEGERDMFAEFDVDGDYTRYGPNVQMVFNNNYSVNKVDYFLRRSIETEVELNPGSTEVKTTVTLINTAPKEPASLLLGSGLEDPIGLNRMMLNLLMPDDAEVDAVRVGDRTTEGFQYLDDSNPVAWDLIEIPAGETVSISFSYSMEVPPSGEFTFTLFPQATAIPDPFSLTIEPAAGLKVTSAAGATLAGGTARVSGTLDRPRSVRLTVART